MTPRLDGSPNLCPTWAEMAARYRSRSRYHLNRAQRFGNTPKGRAEMKDAQFYASLAAEASEKQAEVIAARDGMLTEYRKARANA